MKKALLKSGLYVENQAKLKCLKGTGHLRDSINTKVNDNVATIGTNVFYAPYVEFGTGSFAVKGNGRPGYWVYVKGSEHKEILKYRKIYTYQEAEWIANYLRSKGLEPVITKGQKPSPFLQPALLESKEKIRQIFIDEINRQLKGQ